MPLVILGDIGIGAYTRVRKVSPDGKVVRIAVVWGRHSLSFFIVLLAVGALSIFLRRFWRRRKLRGSHHTAAA